MDSKTDHLAVTEEINVDEATPIDLKKERNTQAYKDTLDIDIENISTFEKRNKVNTTQWRPIYEVIYEAYFIGSKLFSDDFIKECKDNSNEARDIPRKVKNKIKRMEMEQGLYAQVIILRREDLEFVAADNIKNEAKFKFQGQSARSQRWFDLDFYLIGVNFSTRETDFYKKFFKAMMIHMSFEQ